MSLVWGSFIMILTTQWFGTFIVEDGKILERALFPKNEDEIARRLCVLQAGGILDEEREIAGRLTGEDRDNLEGDNERLAGLCSAICGRVEIFPEEHGYDTTLLQRATISLARESLSVKVEKDRHITQAINLLDELTKSKNVLSERLEEWYNIYFPEVSGKIDHEGLVDAVFACKDREEVSGRLGMPELAEKHTGSEVGEVEMEQYRSLSGLIREVEGTISRNQDYIQNSMEEIAPNLTVIAGASVGARLISSAGSLERLSRLPSSTVQMLGAEKALFRFLKHKGLPPKHGVIFMHPRVHSAPYWQRGNIARTFASKISLAAKVDFHSGRDVSEDLLESLEKQMSVIQKKYKEPPKPKPKTKAMSKPKRRKKRGKKRKRR